MKNYKITIPKPCSENWNKMTSVEKGKFCKSCAKTVVDFTKKSSTEIKEYLIENNSERVCGHFYRKQLDSIVIQLPATTFYQQLSFQKIFLLSLLFVMGTTLFSCKTNSGKVQKIDKVEVVNSIKNIEKTIDTIKNVKEKETIVKKIECGTPPTPTIDGITVIETTGELNIVEPLDVDKINEIEEDEEIIEEKSTRLQVKDSLSTVKIMGALKIEGEIEMIDEDFKGPFPIKNVDTPPVFKSDKNLSKQRLIKAFDKKLKQFIDSNFDESIAQNIGLSKGKKRMYLRFVIDSLGNIQSIQTRTPHPKLKNHLLKTLERLPQLIPAKIDGKNVSIYYTVPIHFVVE